MSIVSVGLIIAIVGAVLVLRRRGVRASLLLAGVAPAAGAALVFYAEQGAGGTIETIDDALWWAIATVTTVGYGDVAPVTALGRAAGSLLMLVGVGLFGMLTATVAAYFVEQSREDQVLQELRRIRELLEEVDGSAKPSPGNSARLPKG